MKGMTGAGSGVVDVAYKAMDGEIHLVSWEDLDPLVVVEGRPWRRFPWHLGQRSYSGLYWCATEATLVGYESLLELSRLVMADFDRSSKRIVSQPFQLRAEIDGERLTRVPDYLVLTDEEPMVIDVTRKARLETPKFKLLFDRTRRVVESRGWKYELAHEPPRTEYLNIRFLAGYRRPWLFDQKEIAEVRRYAERSSGATLGEIASGTHLLKRTALPALMHLLWRQDLTFDMTERLSPATEVWAQR
jgi:hypothetical protein